MTGWRSDLATFLSGTVAGAVVLGLGGRAAMAALSIVNGNRPEFSWGGSLEVVLLGTFYGALGGALLAVVRRLWPRAGAWRGVVFGFLLAGVAWSTSTVGRETAAATPAAGWMIVAIAAGVFVVYGVVADSLANAATR